MLRQTSKYLIAPLIAFVTTTSFSQKPFPITKNFLDTLDFKKYRVFIVSKDFDIDFIGRKIAQTQRFALAGSDAKKSDNAINTEYADARKKQLEKQYRINNFSDTADWKKAVEAYQEQKQKLLNTFEQEQKHKISKFDRYFYGYYNDNNEKLVLIRFDPHKIKHYSISGETFVDTLTILVYNIDRDILSLAGWADFKE